MIGVNVTFEYNVDFDRDRVINVADKARELPTFTVLAPASILWRSLRSSITRTCRAAFDPRTAQPSRGDLWRMVVTGIVRGPLQRSSGSSHTKMRCAIPRVTRASRAPRSLEAAVS